MSDKQPERIWPVTLQRIEATVSAHLGPGRVPGNEQGPCFSRQISMYLAKHVGGWSTPQIGRFYNGRHHTTVLYAIQKIEQLRRGDASVDDLLEMLRHALNSKADVPMPVRGIDWQEAYIDAVAERVLRHLQDSRNGLLDRVQLSSAEGRRTPGTHENLP